MKKNRLLTVSCGLILLGATGTVQAANLTVYTDRFSWEAAVSSLFTEQNFNSFSTSTPYESSPVDVGDFSVSMTGDTFGTIWHNIGPVSNSNDVNGTPQINAATGSQGGTTLSFDFNIMAFGANWAGISDNRTTSINVLGNIVSIPNLNGEFWGFVSDTPFTSPLLFLSSGLADGFGIDNVVYSNGTSPVPEPATMLLFGTGIAGLAAARRKKKVS